MSRPEGDPTHWMPLWQEPVSVCIKDAKGSCRVHHSTADGLGIVPADRVTIAREPWTPKAGDRVRTGHGVKVTILATEPLDGCLPCIWHGSDRDQYSSVLVSLIEGPA